VLSEHRDLAAAKTFFLSAKIVTGVTPGRVTTDDHGAYPRAIRTELGKRVRHRTIRYPITTALSRITAASRADVDRCSASRASRQPGDTAKATTNSETSCAPDPACANTFLRRCDAVAIATCAEGRSHSAYWRPPKREARQSSADHTKARKLTKPRYVTLQVCHVTMMAQSPVSMKPVMLLTKIAVQLYRCGAQQNGTHTGPASKVCLCHGHVIEHVGAEGVPQVSRPLSTDLPTESVDIPFGVNPGAARRYGLTSVWPRRPARDPVNGCANPALRRSQMRT
jgi:hypothetical protein